MTACAAFRALRRVPRPASALAALVCSPTPLAHQGARPSASLGGWPGAAGSRAARRATSWMALPHRRVHRAAASKNDPGPRSAPPIRGRLAIGRCQPGDQCRRSSRACCPVSRFPRFRSPVRSRAACQPEHLRPSRRHWSRSGPPSASGLVPSGPGSPAAGSARPGVPASTGCIGATECPDLGGSNHGAEDSDRAPDRRIWNARDPTVRRSV